MYLVWVLSFLEYYIFLDKNATSLVILITKKQKNLVEHNYLQKQLQKKGRTKHNSVKKNTKIEKNWKKWKRLIGEFL